MRFLKSFWLWFRRTLVAVLLVLLIAPFFVPNASSGTENYRQVAGPMATFTNVGGVEIHYQKLAYSGDCNCQPPLILLLHGFGASNFTWRDIARPLTKFGQVVAFERPAYGFTERPTSWSGLNPFSDEYVLDVLSSLVERFGTNRKIVLVGHSAGANLATQWAQAHPSDVSSLILLAPAVLTSGGLPGWLKPVTYLPEVAHLGPVLVGQVAQFGDSIIRSSFVNQSVVTPSVLAGYHAPLQIRGWESALWRSTLGERNSAFKDHLSEMKTATLIITGDQDTIVPTEQSKQLAKIMPNAQLVVIPKAGHLAHEEYPLQILTAISGRADFLFGAQD